MTIFEIGSFIGVIGALLFGAWQISLASKAIRAQSFLNLHQLEVLSRGKDGEDGIAAITMLKKYSSYTDFEQREPESKREAIYNAVAFLNFVATLSEEGYLKMQDAWNIYFMVYKISCDTLLPWWLEHHRKFHPNIFPSFERACLVTSEIAHTHGKTNAHDNKMLPQYIRRYSHASQLTKEKLHDTLNQAGILRHLPPSKP